MEGGGRADRVQAELDLRVHAAPQTSLCGQALFGPMLLAVAVLFWIRTAQVVPPPGRSRRQVLCSPARFSLLAPVRAAAPTRSVGSRPPGSR